MALLHLQVLDVNDKQMKMFTAGLHKVIPHAITQAEDSSMQKSQLL